MRPRVITINREKMKTKYGDLSCKLNKQKTVLKKMVNLGSMTVSGHKYLADVADKSISTFNKIFKEVFGQSVTNYCK